MKTKNLQVISEADERTQIMLDATPLVVNFWNRNAELVDCNNEAVRLYDLTSKQDYLNRFYEFSPEYQPYGKRSRDMVREYVEKGFAEGNCRFEWLHQKLNGEEIPCEITLVRVKYKDDYVVASYARDLRELKAAAAKLHEADERTQIIFDATPIGCCMYDKDYNVFDCNQETLNLFGLPSKQMFLEMFFDFSPEFQPCGKKSSEMAAEEISKTFRTGRNRFEWMHQRLDEQPLPCEITQVRVKFKGEDVIAGYIRDLREHKALLAEINNENERNKIMVKQQAEAEAASKAKSFFLSTMSHEMRTPMNAIIGMAAIGKNTKDIERKDYALKKIEEASNHLLSIINDTLDMGKIEANKLELSHAVFELNHSLHHAVSLVQFGIDVKQIQFYLNVDERIPPYFLGDKQRLIQVLTNLLENAVKYTPKKGFIRLEVAMTGEENGIYELRFEVADNGIGISAEKQEKIFQVFEKAENSAAHTFDGTDLGLVITKRIVELMDGRIWVESELGKGARFIFVIKLQNSKEGPVEYTATDNSGAVSVRDIHKEFHGKKILIVEDTDSGREVLVSMLEGSGLTIDTAANGRDAIDMIIVAPNKYDLIFMDMKMPVMDGLEATVHIRSIEKQQAAKKQEQPRGVPIIAMTANVFKEDIDKCLEAGMNDHIGKPLETRRVLEKLRKYLV